MTRTMRRALKGEGTPARYRVIPIVAFMAAVIIVPQATAGLLASCALAPGTSCLPPDDMGDMPGTLLATRLDPFSFTTSGGITHGAIKTEVFRETAGTLDFYYIVFNAPDSSTPVMRETDLDFSGWVTSVAFRSDGSNVPGFVNGDIPPSLADRSATGSTVEFNFTSGVPPNERSRVVIVSTNAFYFAPGTTMIDGSGPLATFEPAVPEPGCFFLFGSGLLALVVARRRLAR